MSDLTIKATVTKEDGAGFYYEEHQWHNVDKKMMQWFGAKMQHLEAFAKKYNGKKEDDANLTAVLSVEVDGTARPPLTFNGVSYHGLTKFEREFYKIGGELLQIGDKKAAEKAAKKRK